MDMTADELLSWQILSSQISLIDCFDLSISEETN